MMSQPDLQTRFCEKHGCTRSEYAQRAFRHCLYPHARLVASFLRMFAPRYFLRDELLIRCVGMAADANDVQREVDTFQDSNRQRWSLLRDTLLIRVSGRRVMALFDTLRRK